MPVVDQTERLAEMAKQRQEAMQHLREAIKCFRKTLAVLDNINDLRGKYAIATPWVNTAMQHTSAALNEIHVEDLLMQKDAK